MKKWLPILVCSLLVLTACGGGEDNSSKPADDDKDTIVNNIDNCPSVSNKSQLDSDGDGIGDACDNTSSRQLALIKISDYAKSKGASSAPTIQDYADAGVVGVTGAKLSKINQLVSSLSESDVDTQEKISNLLDDKGIVVLPSINDDYDGDGVEDKIDNCPSHPNPDQKDSDNDGYGDICDLDNDEDGVLDKKDNCPAISNPNQRDLDNDGYGDACDDIDNRDDDNDGVDNSKDNCTARSNPDQSDIDNNGIGDVCDTTDMTDDDNDGVINILDNCVSIVNPDQSDIDNDGIGDVCDGPIDTDGDGVPDSRDEFPQDKTRISSITSAQRLLTQATFGATESEIDRIVKIGTDAWIDEQLNAPSAYDSPIDNFKTHLERTIEIATTAEPSIPWLQDGFPFNAGPGIPISQARHYQMSAWWENALGHPINTQHGSDQLRQRVAYALSQLIDVSADDPRLYLRGDSIAYFYDLLAKNAFGNYRTLLGEVSRSAPMGVYLTYQGNQKANPAKSTRPDENFARELIQLFSVGLYELNIDGSPNRDDDVNTYPDAGTNQVPTYTQADVVEMSKVMTGWDTKGNSYFGKTSMSKADYAAQMVFHADKHEDEVAEGGDGKVTVLGKTFALNSGTDGSGMDAALDVVFNHSNSAPFISSHLIRNLVTSNPSSAYVARVAGVYNNNGSGVKGDLKAVIKAILTDPEARSNTNQSERFGKVKEPLLVFTQLSRTFGVKPLDGWTSRADNIRGDGTSVPVNGIYMFLNPQNIFGQGPLRAKSVFSFYSPDYVPSNNFFSTNKMVAPESQIQTDGAVLEVNNRISTYLRFYEDNYITKVQSTPQTLQERAAKLRYNSPHVMTINYDPELALFEQALEGDNNGDFSKLDSAPDKEKAVDALLDHLNKVLLGNTMESTYREKLRAYLLVKSNFRGKDNFSYVHHMISDAIRFIATSSAFMVQR